MSNSTCWLSFFDSSHRSLLPPNNLRDSLTKLFLSQRGKARLLSSVAFTVLMAVFLSQSSFAQELIVNPGFESKLTGWVSNKAPIRTIATTNPVKTGVYSAHINNASQDNEYFYQNLNASPFGNYSFSVWAMVHDASKWSSVGVNVYDANWIKITSASFEMEVNSSSYQKYSKDFTVSGNARYFQVFGYTEHTILKVDDYSLTQAVGGTPTGTLSKNCKIENFRKCDGTNLGHGPWLNILVNNAGGGSNNEYNVNDLTWKEYSDNTATVKGTITKKNDATVAFTVDLLLKGRTTSGTGYFSAVDNASFCVGQKGADWYFYPNASGTLVGTGTSVIGSQINVTLDPSMPWQVGTGGTTRFKTSFGSSAWVNLAVVKQPSSSGKTLSIGTEGTDFYLEMPGCTPPSADLCTSFSVSGVSTNVTTNGGTNGAINVTLVGGQSPFIYSWSNGATTEDLTGLEGGIYWLTVTDANKCVKTYQAVITQPNSGICTGFRTQTQGGWGSKANGENPGAYRDANFVAAFPNGVTIGCGTKLLKLTTAKAVEDFLPSGSTPTVLPAGTLTNPAGTYSNVLAGQVVALTLNIGFDNYDATFGSSTTNLKNLFITTGTFSGKSVQFLLDEANKALGGCSTTYTLSDINDVVTSVNENYVNGTSTGDFLGCCNNVTSGGTIGTNQSGCSGFDPVAFTSVANPSGGGTTALELVWLKSTTSSVLTTTTQSQWTTIVGATGLTYDAGPLTQTTYFIRCSRRAGCTDYVGESNVVTVTINANCGGKDPICLSRKSPVQNSSLCGDATKSYGMWFNDLKGNVASPSQYFSVKSGELTEFCDGTAVLTYTACVVGGGANDCITATVNYSGRTGIPVTGSPVLNTHCTTYNPNVGDWYYYPTSSGSFLGAGIYAGLTGTYTQNMGAFQVGTGGSLNDISKFGASSWFKIGVTNGGTNNWTTISKDGDVNINLGTSTNIASVIATANPTSICKGENVVLTATIDAASKSANCSPTYSWVGSNGFTSNQATVTNNDVQGATTYTVTVSFTAINGSKCSVTATTGVALNVVCCDNVTNGGQIAANQRNCGAFDPAPFTNVELPTGGTGTLEYIWLKSTTATTFTAENAAEWIPIAGTNSPNLDVNNISVTTAYQRCSRRAGCTDYDGETNVIVVIIDKVPNAPTTTPAAICGTGTVTLGASCTTGVPQWYATSTGGTALETGASFTTPSILVNTTYYVSCKSPEGCESTPRTEVIATINSDATTPTVTPATICGTGTVTLGATCSTGTAQWFAAATGGSSIATGASFTTLSISTTTTYYVSCKSGAGCESARVEVKATVIGKITDGGKIQYDESICPGKTPSQITSATPASGGDANLAIEYIWLQTTSLTNGICPQNIVGQTLYSEIPNTNSPNYQPGAITQTTCYIRCSRRAGCTDYIGGESNIVKKTILANCQGKDPICLSRKTPVENSSLCGDATKSYGMWFLDLKGNVASPNQHFSVKSGELTEFCDGTAVLTYTACVTGGGAGDCITATVNYSGRTGTPPVGSPVSNTHCTNYNPNVSDWYYYPVSNGTFTGAGIYADMTGTYTQNMGAFQVGTGGNLNDIVKFGASSWFKINITNGGTNNWTTVSKDGDININLGASTTIASVTATANPKAICSGEKVDLTATLDVNSKSANCSPSYSWVGSNGFTSTQATATNTNVTTSTTYTVIVTFTGINGSKCSVTATTGVTVNPIPNPPTVTPAAICGTGTVTLGATCSTGTAQWFSSATGGASIATGESFTTPSISATTTYYVSCKTDATCESARTPVTATINPIPATPTVKPAIICGTGTAILGATCTTGVAQWYATATGGASIATGASFTTPSISLTTTYYVSCKTDVTCESGRIPVTATVNGNATAPTVTPATTCGTGSVTLGATCTTGVAQWYSSATGGTALATGASYTTPSLSATTTYYVSCKSTEGCESAITEVKAIVIVKITDGGSIKADEIICVGGTPSKITNVTLPTGGDANIAIEYVWLQTTSLTATGTCPLNIVGQNLYTEIPNTNTPDYQPGAITVATCYIRCSRRAGCLDYIGGESNTIKKSVKAFPTAITVTPAAICGTGTVTLGATCSTGATAMWYAALTGGASIATGASFTTPSISATTTYYVSCKTTAGGCESSRTSVTATINLIPTAPTFKPAAICGTGTVELGAICTVGTPQWYVASTGGVSIATGASFTTPSISATTTYYVICKSAEGCESGRAPVTATVNGNATAPTTTPAAICGTGTVTLGATCTTGTAMWYTASTGGTSIATGASFTTPNLSVTTTYYVSCKTTEGCESGRTPVTATVNSAGTAPTVTPATTCGTGSVTLGATCATGTATWYSSATGGTAIATGASFTTPSLTTTTFYYVSCKSTAGCESARTKVKATVNRKITDGGTIKADETICSGTTPSKIVNVKLPTGGNASLAIEYIWLKTTSLNANGTCPANVVGQNLYTEIPGSITPDYQPGAITQTTCYIRCSRRKGCTDYIGGESNIVKKTVTSPFTISATTNPNAVCNGTNVSIMTTTTATGTINYAWAGPNGFTANTKDVSIPNVTILANGVYTVSASNGGGCKAVATVHVKVVSCLKIGDLVFNDKNNNGKQDAGELGIAGVIVKLFDSANNQVGSSTTTDANGKYSFSNLPSGSYVVEISAPASYKSSTGTNGSATGTYEPKIGSTNVNNEDNGTTVGGQIIRSKPVVLTTTDNTNVDFGLFKPAKLGDFVFRDSNGNGIQEAGEIGVASVTVKLFDSANNVVATTTTDANGKYLFDNLTAGNYTVEFVKSTLPSGLGFSPQGTTMGDKDSDANVTTGRTAIITLTEGQTNNDIDAGLTGPCDKDITPPVLSVCPYDILLKTRGIVATVSWTAPTATDNCGTPVITSTKVSGSQFPIGKTVVTYTATDAKGNKTTCSFTVTIIKIITCETDTQAPVFYDCPTDITVNTTGTGATALWDHPSVGDNCGIPSVIFNYSPGQSFPVGVTTVIYTAKDAKGNISYCMFKVTVIKKTTLSTGPVTESMNTTNSVNAASESTNTTTSTPVTGATSARIAAVEEVKVGDEVSVYPNPTNSDFSIELSAELMRANSSVEVSVFNMTGTTLFTQTAKGTERVSVKVPVQDMPNGTYFVNVALDNGRMIIKKLQIVK